MTNPHRLFLLDGLGATISALSLGVLLPYFNDRIGMPLHHLYFLAGLAVLFAVYSLSCYAIRMEKWRKFMLGIAVVNLLYCLLTMFLLFRNSQGVTGLGVVYFLAEIVVIMVVVYWELRAVGEK